jgi:multiple sugar transport system substrate-binding protein
MGDGIVRKIRWFGILLVFVLIAGACGDGDGSADTASPDTGNGDTAATEPAEQIELDVWVFEEGGINETLQRLEAEYEALYPNVDVVMAAFPEENYGVKVQTAVAADQAPDLVLVFGPDMWRQGLLLPLNDFFEEKGVDLSTFTQSIVAPGDEFSCNWEGNLYCLGSYTGSVQLIYNKDMFDAAGVEYPPTWPPMTPQDFFDKACALTDPDNEVWGAGVSDPMAFLPWEVFIDDDARSVEGYVNGELNVSIFEAMGKAVQDGCIPSGNIFDPWEQGRDFFSQGQLAMVITDFQDLDQIDEAGINWGTAITPTPPGYDPYFFVWTDSLGVMADSEHPDEAMEYIYLLVTRGSEIRYEATGDLPIDSKVAEALNWAGDSQGRIEGLEVLSHARPGTFIPNRWDVMGPLWDAFGLISGGEATAQEALDDAAPKVQDNLEQNWRVWEEGE